MLDEDVAGVKLEIQEARSAKWGKHAVLKRVSDEVFSDLLISIAGIRRCAAKAGSHLPDQGIDRKREPIRICS